ncbi:Gfo/Idh/MocA family oxidoreductase [Janibacter cremeus]|uniref:Gfo/Idh/MocA family protein n=1 Tax=Janibacter cremeus TaxID=1285192 RepID=UPI0023FA47BC|nr:Gfo/Idh/MocA family oxidoreductase [Janibacter cremeus]WEV77329.1 Gfo/Idh/MocA family oxidoreductase [Janibacter cremeus]
MRIGLTGLGRIGAFHADTLLGLPAVDTLVVTDARPETARAVAERLRAEHPGSEVQVVDTPEELVAAGLDGLVVATATAGHAEWIRRGLTAGIPTFCEKPVAGTLEETIELAGLEADSSTPVHVGHQRRFDAGFRRAREAVASGEFGFVHTIRANTHDQDPPPAEFIATSGGIFRDCGVHDFDAIRFVTGREVVSVYATGSNKGADYFSEAGDVDTGAAVLTLDDDTLVLMSTTRYNGGGHDVRMEVMGEKGTVAVGLDHSLAMTSAEPGTDFPRGPQKWSFMERFLPAYQAELTAFFDVAAGRAESPCTIADALEAFRTAEACELSRAEGRAVTLSEIKGL